MKIMSLTTWSLLVRFFAACQTSRECKTPFSLYLPFSGSVMKHKHYIKKCICTCASVTISLMFNSLKRTSNVLMKASFSIDVLFLPTCLLSTVTTLMMSRVSSFIVVYVQHMAECPYRKITNICIYIQYIYKKNKSRDKSHKPLKYLGSPFVCQLKYKYRCMSAIWEMANTVHEIYYLPRATTLSLVCNRLIMAPLFFVQNSLTAGTQ